MTETPSLALIGAGMLGGAIARRWLASGVVAPERLHVATRSGAAPALADWPGVRLHPTPQAAAEAAEAALLCLPPAALPALSLRVPDRLVLSVMAGADVARLQAATGAPRVIRAMSSPAAELGLAYTPWTPSPQATEADHALARRLFSALGETDRLDHEPHLDLFTALTGPVPGFVAAFAAAMAAHAVDEGVPAPLAERAVRQLFRAAGEMMARDATSPQAAVQEMIDYAGTTAAGLEALEAAGLRRAVAAGLAAATEKARTIAG
ncbi:pyrroline-5-carboxylate reductase dimerization domain-containing protein [Albimonas sp. CAU 1670]|uniref:pyrroline-5-carboxylate reductase family protein n=1 Tax=Albimonas sp. CAU 1670 TaxID=3032599 RepID=UPI0023DA31BD|nr:pyrroline-5-carboxylate reductase dimerization domain-containing protein [Albimonas sp. CAU 1670]MDF2235233.1 pyrroline-5-carboxylate reductase dimerization domain-containing protein [Albimonas sp. CAU 1670]